MTPLCPNVRYPGTVRLPGFFCCVSWIGNIIGVYGEYHDLRSGKINVIIRTGFVYISIVK